jgi:ATP-dependent RNA helicase DDX19/DBP5
MTVVTTMGKYTAVTTEYGIKEALPRESGPVTAHILVGTPGTICGLLQRRQLDVSKLRVFVVDEADNMLDQEGLGDQTARVKT